MKRVAAAVSLLALSGALVFPSAAAPFALSQSDVITQDVSLAPTSAPNGDYAYLDDDELVVDLTASNPNLAGDAEGVNPDAVTTISNVFRIHYNGSQYAHVWITDESDAVTFVVDGEPIQSEAANVTLGPNESVAVGVVVDTTGDGGDGLIDQIQVNARVADPETATVATGGGTGGDDSDDTSVGVATTSIRQSAPSETERRVEVRNPDGSVGVDLDPLPLDAGGNVTLDELDLTATGGATVDLGLDVSAPDTDAGPGSLLGVESLGAVAVTEADAGSVDAATLRFSVSPAYLDARNVDSDDLTVFRTSDGETTTLPVRVVGERDDGRVVVEADTPGFSTFTVAALRPAIRVSEASLSTTDIEVGERTTVTARVSNDGRAAGERTLRVTLDGDLVAERVVDLAPNETTTVTVDVAPDGPGSYEVAVDGTTAGTLVVADGESTDDAAAGGATLTEQSDLGDTTPGGASTSGAGTVADGEPDVATAGPVEEPAGLGLPEVGGLTVAVALVVATLLLVRRVSR
ncbi:PGF-pre-PGF domain-containing protein [Halobaculum marinum]|uniref:PGF-pre-PGF domain-containing protein n=1 Tax=Halobaculum marinum TaxID=3031996 RepID=A0ABD5WSB2_9EURY|nr:PGF-pre-PGF domain-containing protein [Halobaculum sp. DT55]